MVDGRRGGRYSAGFTQWKREWSMKISMEWLGEYLPDAPNAPAAGEALTHGGLPVEIIEHHGDDEVMDVEVTSNRGDCLSHVGVARELGALLDLPGRGPEFSLVEGDEKTADAVAVAIESDLCPRYVARLIRGVRVGPGPAWMARRLEAVGLRSINNVVDVTNYVMFEMGQPLHAFDFGRLARGRIVVRMARKGERLVSIDGHERALEPDMLVIADAEKPAALAGVMGGLASEVSGATVDVLLEAARFDPLCVRSTARRLAMQSDSSYRFERGIDPTLPDRAADRAAAMIAELAGGTVSAGAVVAGESPGEAKRLSLRLSKLRSVLGVEIPADEAAGALGRLGFAPEIAGDRIEVVVPSHRLDVNIEVDLVEEVARVVGYDRVPTRDEIAIRVAPTDYGARAVEAIRSTLVAAGYFEAITFSWVSDALAGDFMPPGAAGLARARTSVRKADGRLRPSLLPGLLESVRRNETVGTAEAKLFEIGSTFHVDEGGGIVETRRVAWVGGGDVRAVRGAVEAVLGAMDGNKAMKVIPENHPGYAKGAGGRIEWDGRVIGRLGRIERKVADALGLRHVPAAAEIELAPLLSGYRRVPRVAALAKYPPVRRDLSLVVDESTRFEAIERSALGTNPAMLESLEYVTTYRGKPLEKGAKSVTIALVFRSDEGTLTAEQVEPAVARIIAAAGAELGATVRG